MKKTFITLVLTALTASTALGAGIFDNLVYNLRFGYSVGGTAPIGMPASIRSLDSYKLEPNFSLGLGVYKPLSERWGLTTGLHIENKGMNIDATVKNYHMAIVRGGQRLEGQFTGHNASEVEMWMLTLPLQATYAINDKVHIKLGPYMSYVRSHTFRGYAYDGYLRVGDPTGAKVELGSDDGSRGTYDFSDDMRNLQFGMMLGAEWYFYKRWGAFADLSWGFTGIFKKDFNTIEQTLYPIYGTIGVSYRIK
ncbi:porin family protein [uncultured Prevotella sp.]|uniref:porin family protein n=1 Tax=uncultured Prevotella sp. TaxID=159272 RepID=UPI00262E1F3A|nr:porin family protein [uncultured Prevotella sp.]